MLVVKIEIWPGGDEDTKRELGTVHITNIGGTMTTGEYDVELFKSPEYAAHPGIWKRGKVKDFPRTRLGPYDLLLRALRACISDRNP